MSVAIEEKLFSIRYRCDQASHLTIREQSVCQACTEKACLTFCPAAVYAFRDGEIHVAYENCIECGTCRIACSHQNIAWQYPKGGYGIAYKIG